MSGKGYLLDTGVFIEAHRRYWYRLDLNPGFWEALLHFQGAARLRSLDRCRKEIAEGDMLATWIAGAPDGLFVSTADPDVAAKYAEVMTWAAAAAFTDDAKAEFAGNADGWVVAYAAVQDLIVVTHETHEPARRNKVKIPNACKQFGVEWMDTFEMLRQLEVRFAWGAPPHAPTGY
jgi:hypothetical protein